MVFFMTGAKHTLITSLRFSYKFMVSFMKTWSLRRYLFFVLKFLALSKFCSEVIKKTCTFHMHSFMEWPSFMLKLSRACFDSFIQLTKEKKYVNPYRRSKVICVFHIFLHQYSYYKTQVFKWKSSFVSPRFHVVIHNLVSLFLVLKFIVIIYKMKQVHRLI